MDCFVLFRLSRDVLSQASGTNIIHLGLPVVWWTWSSLTQYAVLDHLLQLRHN